MKQRKVSKVPVQTQAHVTAADEDNTAAVSLSPSPSPPQPQPWRPSIYIILLAVILTNLLLVGTFIALSTRSTFLWSSPSHNATITSSLHIITPTAPSSPSSSSPSAITDANLLLIPLLTSISLSLTRYSRALQPMTYPDDKRVVDVEMGMMRGEMVEVEKIMKGNQVQNQLPLNSTTTALLSTLPTLALTLIISHRSGLIKELLASELHGHSYITRKMLDAFERKHGEYIHAPLKLMLSYGELLNWGESTAVSSTSTTDTMSPIEFAVDRSLLTAVALILPSVHRTCTPTSSSSSSTKLSSLELAENNHDAEMIELLQKEGIECLLRRSVPHSTHIASTTKPIPPPSHTSSGWRPSSHNSIHHLTTPLENRGCPFDRIALHELTEEIFWEKYVKWKKPLIITGAVGYDEKQQTSLNPLPPSFRITSSLTRSSVSTHWSNITVSSSSIPYGEHFSVQTEKVSFERYLRYMDDVYEEQQKEEQNDKAKEKVEEKSPPYYIFDYSMFLEKGWNLASSSEENKEATEFYHLPKQVQSLFAPKAASSNSTTSPAIQSIPQFYLGPEGSGAPFHFHCPAINLLVYGRKQWWLLEPATGFYSKQTPLKTLRNKELWQRWRRDGRYDSAASPDPYSCTQYPGELFFVPSQWSHATINLQESVGVAVERDTGGC